MATPFLTGVSVAAAAMGARGLMEAYTLWSKMPPRLKNFYQGGFEATMTKREAAKILGLRESAPPEKVHKAYRRIMIANHPDAGGSDFLSAKVNEAKDKMLGKTKAGGNPFG
mmetsp:Transcript_10030/g.11704  ORF Transcript_10030/g.11704 Transcript_10030/m.11704 type:complete len:112 (+) Transcript_10030:280-615(+)|eukprot:CAMPEP_0197852850 /NCGR_PEP_ID=MMETSP1438-20131217/21548_1 /TAXON_ID=1461541 /ORGANISM="Pterosperma sp., Strain CCMP1384" /LENGTH=111 /DNA_ID=CAMNT_0043467051 /DNA_START=269 /DNA_END=604 /DNA_ORIENTATION=-